MVGLRAAQTIDLKVDLRGSEMVTRRDDWKAAQKVDYKVDENAKTVDYVKTEEIVEC